ncbi:hypothetical protein WJX82_002727 [Trebouxia sp. C0006]
MVRAGHCRVAGVLIVVATVLVGTSAQEAGDLVSQYSTYARQDPVAFVSLLGSMPPEEQKALLLLVGATMQQKKDLPCNPFGGAESCMTLSADSKFAQVCSGHDLKVDCAYYSDELQEVDLDPGTELKQLLQARGLESLEASCPQCFENQQKLWCAQTVPVCGSYQENLVGLLLPAVAQAVSAEQNGLTQNEALSSVMPQLLQASSLSLPCREMCEAVMSTCSCSQERTLGSLLQKVMDGLLPGQQLPEGFSQQIFGSVYDEPLCSLYAPSGTEGFTGRCETLPTHCSRNASWCDGGSNPDADAVEELMAVQLTKAMFGWVGNHTSGLFADEQEVIADADMSGEKSIEDKYARQSGSSGKSSASAWAEVLVPLGIIAAVAVVVAAAAVGLAVSVRPGILSELTGRLRTAFGRREGLGDADYREFEQSTEHEPLVG